MARDGEPRHVANAVERLAAAAVARGSYSEARAYREEYLAIARELQASLTFMVDALNGLGWLALLEGDFAAARPVLDEAVVAARAANINHYLAPALHNFGELNRFEDNLQEARGLLEESLAIAKEVPSKPLIAAALSGLGELARMEKDHAAALGLHREALQLRLELGDQTDRAESLQALGGLAAANGRLPEAARLLAAAGALWKDAGSAMPPVARAGYEKDVGQVRSGLATEAFDAEWAKGSAMSAEEAVDYAMTEKLVSP